MATTKNEMTQIKAMEIINGMINEGTLVVDEDVKVKLSEIEVAMRKRKDNKKKKELTDVDKANIDRIIDYLEDNTDGDTVTNIVNKAGLVTDEGVNISTSKCTSMLKAMPEVERVELSAKKVVYRLKTE